MGFLGSFRNNRKKSHSRLSRLILELTNLCAAVETRVSQPSLSEAYATEAIMLSHSAQLQVFPMYLVVVADLKRPMTKVTGGIRQMHFLLMIKHSNNSGQRLTSSHTRRDFEADVPPLQRWARQCVWLLAPQQRLGPRLWDSID